MFMQTKQELSQPPVTMSADMRMQKKSQYMN